MKPKASKAIPYIAGFFLLLILAGFSPGAMLVPSSAPACLHTHLSCTCSA
jgi:hypothetical protein